MHNCYSIDNCKTVATAAALLLLLMFAGGAALLQLASCRYCTHHSQHIVSHTAVCKIVAHERCIAATAAAAATIVKAIAGHACSQA
jgi:hypothetical protein